VANKKITDALVKAGLVRPDQTDEARRAQAQAERRAREAAELDAKLAANENGPAPPPWEAAATGQVVERSATEARPPTVACVDCGEPFDPTSATERAAGRVDQCARCADEDAGPPRKRGQMIWTHKTAPTLEIEGGRKLTPEELAAMRRR
jgi:hypothetical protein